MFNSTPSLAILLTATALALSACNSAKPTINPNSTPEIIDGTPLYKVENSRADLAYMDKNVDFGRYKSIYIEPLNFSKLKIVQPATSIGSKPFEFTDKARTKFIAINQKSLARQLSEDQGYTIVNTPQADTLIIANYLLELRPNATNEANRPASARSKVFTEGSGSMTIGAIFMDGQKKSVVAMIEDEKKSIQLWQENTAMSNIRDVELMFSSWGRAIRSRLDELQKKTP